MSALDGWAAVKAAECRVITSVGIVKQGERVGFFPEGTDLVAIRFDDGTGLNLWDAGQDCCEERYMTCDDDLSAFVGAKFLGAEERDGTGALKNADDSDVHETTFLVVKTSLGDFTVCTHNEHNGYYGGFNLTAREVKP